MIADHLLKRMWTYDGEDRRVEVWLRHDGQWFVSSMRRRGEGKAGWVEKYSFQTDSQAAAMATAETWKMAAQQEMP